MKMDVGKVWVLETDAALRRELLEALQAAAFLVRGFATRTSLQEAVREERPDVLMLSTHLSASEERIWIERFHAELADIALILLTEEPALDSTVTAFEIGAFDCIAKPFSLDEVIKTVRRARYRPVRHPAAAGPEPIFPETEAAYELIGTSPAMRDVFRMVARLSLSHATVLLTGESGTGKSRIAEALHRHGPRARKPFVSLNLAALPPELIEFELFGGHERGAFTGTPRRRIGRIEQADGGTLFLDEIGDLPADLQPRLLRLLTHGDFFPVGSQISIPVDVRIIAATHKPLGPPHPEPLFRDDLFHRLSEIHIHLPPLRDRRQDIPLLARHFLQRAATELRVEAKAITPEAMAILESLDWPGNVRQLENACRTLTAWTSARGIGVEDLPPEWSRHPDGPTRPVSEDWLESLEHWLEKRLRQGTKELAKHTIAAAESTMIQTALRFTHGRRFEAARILGYGRNTLTRKIAELKLKV
jgi:two-component system nitrogen regulation response regulator GlnG